MPAMLSLALSASGLLWGQSAYQQALFTRTAAAAKAASVAAEPELLAFLDRQDFRAELTACCPDVAKAPAAELMARLVQETRALEVVSGIPVELSEFTTSLDDAMANTELDCDWATGVRAHVDWPAPGKAGWLDVQDGLEMYWYGLKPFTAQAAPATLQEAQERISYFLLNDARTDAGSPVYGPVSLVLDTDAIAKGTIVSAIDTGEWSTLCNATYPPIPGYVNNCSGYNAWKGDALGTLDDFTHLFLPNTYYWNYTSAAKYLARRVQRLLYPWQTPLQSGVELIHYFEVAPIMPLSFETTHKFVIGEFPALFGSGNGTDLRTFADKWKLPLVWSLGLNLDGRYDFWNIARVKGPLQLTNRVLDSASAHANASNATAAAAIFDAYWTKAAALRAAGGHSSQWAALWKQMVAELPTSMQLKPMLSSSCVDASKCIGLSLDDECVCRV